MVSSIKSRLIIVMVLISFIPVATLGFLSYRNSERMLINNYKAESLQSMQNVREYFMDYYIDEIENAVYVLSGSPDLLNFKQPEASVRLKNRWDDFRRLNPDIWFVYFADTKGDILSSPVFGPIEGYDPRKRLWYTETLKHKGLVVWTDPYLQFGTSELVLTTAKTVEDANGVIGILAIDTKLNQLNKIINNVDLGPGGYAILVDKQGRIIAHPDKTQVGKNVGENKWFNHLHSGLYQDSIYYKYDGKDVFISYVTIPKTGWQIVGIIPRETLENAVVPIKKKTLLITFISSLMALLISVLLYRSFADLLNRFIITMGEVESGNLNTRLIIKKSDSAEYVQLGQKFNNMVATIESLLKERDRTEKHLKFLNMRDPLTGLYNRNHFESEIQRYTKKNNTTLGIIVCDVDGLKLVNDTMGHHMGDKLLIAAASVIKSIFRQEDIAARIGGDEFAILLPNADENVIKKIIKRISKAIQVSNEENPGFLMSLSCGYAVSSGDNMKSATELFVEADNNMYREKLYHSQSNRSAIVQTLTKAMEARDFVTEGHAERLQDLAANLAVAAGIPASEITNIRLLAQFHDIGKVGIPDRVLNKPGRLNQDEKIEMQRHSEIGYRIAQSAPDLAHIADWILKHHEWWNGQGYPLGLKGEEIPLECRILSIVDAYDAMTSDRPYRKALSHEVAVMEMIRCSGSQFDPNLVEIFIRISGVGSPESENSSDSLS
ncbi:diguanylate cyclase (GGDEF) domain-containing protein [Desulfotomaculum arcticum]|uniref:Diguanylate cyclase (GGDEF) domain-containing protein n=1 Tax=Desulfotruncus arcticus DSM 17038 TaxID=1121424 RepID=A0A1I2V9P5_9FIRM|nr:diguanylate cyclase [Desulfotruncus arcticus]SFG83871.1 diguanylate cyclase (GGDEF) domain-containing protein [Desulfotomaculum arcticum] [Desulfotruncus arcticus DSM 17038]